MNCTGEVHWCLYKLHSGSVLRWCAGCTVGDYRSVKWCRQSNRGGKQGPLSSFDPPKLCPPMQNTNTKQFWIQILPMQIQIQSNSESPDHKADRQNTHRNIAKDCEGCLVSLSVSQVNFINVLTGVSQLVKICHEFNKVTYSVVLVDCPTQLICIWIFICVSWQS